MNRWRRLFTWVALSALAVTFLCFTPGMAHADTSITIDGSQGGQIFDGVGALSAGASSRLLIDYPEPERSEILDYLFKPNYGASLQILKVEIGGDTNSTDGSEPSAQHTPTDQNFDRGYEWWLMQQAKARNPNIKLWGLEWGAPGWIGGGNFWSQDNINYIINWIQHAQSVYNLHIDYIGGWNERGYNKTWYEDLKSALQAHGLTTQIVAADTCCGDNAWGVATDMKNDPTFDNAVDIVGGHYPDAYQSSADAQSLGKPVWASEDGSGNYDGNAAGLARSYNRNYIVGRMTATINWSLIASFYDNLPYAGDGLMLANQPWSGYYYVAKSIWATAQTTQFTSIGWQYIDSASGYLGGNSNNGSYVTLKSPNGSDYSTIIETTTASAAQNVSFTVTGGLSTGTVHVWATNLNSSNPGDWFVQQADITPDNGAYSLTVQPGYVYSLTTTTGQGKGSATSPAPASLSLPYSDNFDSYSSPQEAKYFSDMEGSFEATSCIDGHSGGCLEQEVDQQPIQWAGGHTPFSYMGDDAWSNYTVSVDALLEEAGHVRVAGRIAYQPESSEPNAYLLDVQDTGYWELQVYNSGTKTVLASGNVSFSINTWHNLSLSFNGDAIAASIDGNQVASLTDTTYSSGLAGLGTYWNKAQFDNFSVQPLGNQQNLLQDPGFEEQTSSTVSAPWYTSGASGTQGIDVNQDQAHSGQNNAWVGNASSWSAVNQNVTLQTNTSYMLSCWVKTTSNFTTGYVGIITPDRSAEHNTTFGAEGSYTQITVPFNSGSYSSWYVYIGYEGGSNMQLQVDDCALVAPTAGSGYFAIVNRNSGKVLDDVAYGTGNGAAVDQWTNVYQTNEEWELISTGDGYYKIMNRNSGEVLEVNGYSTSNGGTIDQWSDVNQTNEEWQIVDSGNGYYTIVSRSSGLLLEVNGGSTSNGGSVDQWSTLNQPYQQWSFVLVA